MKTPGILLLLLLSIATAYAEESNPAKDLKYYDVEIIIFEDAHARYLSSERWHKTIKTEYLTAAEINTASRHPAALSSERSTDETNIDEINAGRFQSIQPTILNKQYKRINASSNYNVLFYGAWRQPGLNKNQAFSININGLQNTSRSATTDNTLSGTFRLVLRRFLHMHIKLDYQRKTKLDANALSTLANTSENGVSTAEKFAVKTPIKMPDRDSIAGNYLYQLDTHPITSHRRMRSKELHYIDHPLVGILVQINPVKKP